MLIGIIATDGGPHPPEKWAQVTASQVLQIASNAPSALLNEARRFEEALVALLVDHHGLVQDHERNGLKTEGSVRLRAKIETYQHLPNALEDIIRLARGTSFEAHFAKPEVQAYIKQVLHEHFHHVKWIERSWYSDQRPTEQHSIAFREQALHGLGAYAEPAPGVDRHPGVGSDSGLSSRSKE